MKMTISRVSVPTCLLALVVAPAAEAQNAVAPSPATPAAATLNSREAVVGADDTGVADIIVTAQRRSESLQKAALTIEVVRAETLAVGGVTAPSQLTSILPTVQVSAAGAQTGVYVRGVGGFPGGALTSPAVPYYVDGVYVARTQSVTSEFYDVDRLELVKGPQGTLYGRNASGGAINILTARPKLGEVTGHAEIEVGDYGNQNGEVAINLPLGDKVAIRASGQIVDKSGYTSLDLGDDVHQSGRLKLLWQATSDISLLLNGSYGHIGGLGGAFVTLNRQIPGWYPWLDASDPRSQAFVLATAAVPVPGFVRPTQFSDARQDESFYNLSAQLDWHFGSTTLTIIPAYRDSRIQNTNLLGFLFANGYGLGSLPASPETSHATSLEARLSGDSGRLKWVAGLYYFNEKQFQQIVINNGFLSSNGWLDRPSTLSYAAFGQASFEIVDRVRLIGGLRYTSDRRALDGQYYLISPNAFQGPPPAAAAGCAFPLVTQPQCLVDTFSGRRTYQNVSWKGGFEADVFTDSLLYATASRGFKAGGFNQQSSLGRPGQADPFRPETLTSYEAGLKSRFAGNHLQVNVSGYYWDYKDHQEPFITFSNTPGIVTQLYINAGRIEVYGGNLDIVARPWAGGTVSGSVEYAHSQYKSFLVTTPTFAYSPQAFGCPVASQNPGLTTLDCAGFQVSRTPEFSGRFAVDQEFALGRGKLIADGSVTFASARWVGTDFVAAERAEAYGKIDLSLTYRDPAQWSITGFIRNVNNASVYTEAAKNPFSSLIYANIQPPRSVGVQGSFRF